MHPPLHMLRMLESIHKWVRVGWVGRDSVYASQAGLSENDPGAYALLDLYPQRLARMSFQLHWDDMGPVYGSPYDRLQRVPIVKAWVSPTKLFNGDCVPMLRHMIMPLAKRIREANEKVLKEREAWRRNLAGEMAERMVWDAHHSPHSSKKVARKHLTRSEKESLSGAWRERVIHKKPLEASILGMV